MKDNSLVDLKTIKNNAAISSIQWSTTSLFADLEKEVRTWSVNINGLKIQYWSSTV